MSRRVLIVSPFPPRLDAVHGGARAIAELLRALARTHTLALVYCRGPDEPALDPALAPLLDRVEEVTRPRLPAVVRRARLAAGLAAGRPMWATRWRIPELTPRLQREVAEWAPDLVQLDYHVMGQYRRAVPQGIPVVLVEYEAGAAAAREALAEARGLKRAVLRADVRAWERFEREVASSASAVVAFTARDRAGIARVAPDARVVEIPLTIEPPPAAADPRGEAGRILFVGNCMHPPNLDAAERLARAIFPRVRRAVPDASLDLVGEGTPPALAGDGVRAHGRVPEVAPWLGLAAVVAAPLRLGGGMRLKVLEALAAGKALVATPRALEGLPLTDGEQVRIAETDDALAGAITELLADPDARTALARRARAWAVQALGWEATAAAYGALYDELIGRDA